MAGPTPSGNDPFKAIERSIEEAVRNALPTEAITGATAHDQETWRRLQSIVQEVVDRTEQSLAGRATPLHLEVDRARVVLAASGRYSESEIWRMNDVQLVRAARELERAGLDVADVVKQAEATLVHTGSSADRLPPSDLGKVLDARAAVDRLVRQRRAEEEELLRDVLRANSQYTPDEVARMPLDRLVDEVRKEAGRQLMGVEDSKEEPSAIADRISQAADRELRTQLVDLVEQLGNGRWPRSAIEQLSDRDLARIGERLLTDLQGPAPQQGEPGSTRTPVTPGGSGTGGTGDSTGTTTGGGPGSGVTGGTDADDPLLGDGPPGAGDGVGPGDVASGYHDDATGAGTTTDVGGSDVAPGGSGPASTTEMEGGTPAPPGGESGSNGWVYLGDDWFVMVDGEAVPAQLWTDPNGNPVAVTPDGEMRSNVVFVDQYGEPIPDGGSTTVGGSSSAGGRDSSTTGGTSGGTSAGATTDDEDSSSDDDEDSSSDGEDDAGGSGSGSDDSSGTDDTEGTDGTDGDDVEYTPAPDGEGMGGATGVLGRYGVDDIRSMIAAKIAGRNPGNVDPTDDGGDRPLDPVTASLLTGLDRPTPSVKPVDPVDPDSGIATARTGRLPTELSRPDGGVIDPADDAAGSAAGMGREDDPFSGLRPGLEPSASDDTDDLDDGDAAGFHPLGDAVRLTRHLGLRPTDPSSGIGFADLDS
jgi:hypothetical protein